MRRLIHCAVVILLVFCICPSPTQSIVEESSTGKHFPATVSFQYGGKVYSLTVTGVSVRKKLVFKGYGIAHYMDEAGFEDRDAAFAAALSDTHAKQITMDFARDIDVEKMQKAFREGFKKSASDEEAKAIDALVDQFIGYFDNDVKKNDQFVLRWLPGGTVVAIVQGEEKESITNVTFATVLWRIWLGKHSVVNRKNLVAMTVAE